MDHAHIARTMNAAIEAKRAEWQAWAESVCASCQFGDDFDAANIAAKLPDGRRIGMRWINEAFDLMCADPAAAISTALCRLRAEAQGAVPT